MSEEGSVQSFKPTLYPHKPSICPPSGIVLTGGRHDDLSLIQYSNDSSLPHLIVADIIIYLFICESAQLCHFKGFVWNQPLSHSVAIF